MQPYNFRDRSGDPLAITGLGGSWYDPTGNVVRTFCIITITANDVAAQVYGRMPELLAPSDFAQRLDPDTQV